MFFLGVSAVIGAKGIPLRCVSTSLMYLVLYLIFLASYFLGRHDNFTSHLSLYT